MSSSERLRAEKPRYSLKLSDWPGVRHVDTLSYYIAGQRDPGASVCSSHEPPVHIIIHTVPSQVAFSMTCFIF